MKNILIIAHFCSDFDGKGNNRFNYLANELINYQCNVELVTTDFSHSKKKKREIAETNLPYKVTMINEPGYKKNVSLKRFYSHYVMGKNLKKYLAKIKKPDIIYCGVPSLDAAKVAAKYANENNIRFIIDVQDTWPESISSAIDTGIKALKQEFKKKFTAVGLPHAPVSINYERIVLKEIILKGSKGHQFHEFKTVARMVADKKLDVKKYITTRIKLSEVQAGFEGLKARKGADVKAVIEID